MFSLLLKELVFIFHLLSLQLVLCRVAVLKRGRRISSIMQFIFYFWSFEISKNSLRNQKVVYRGYSNFLLNMAFISPSEVENIYIS